MVRLSFFYFVLFSSFAIILSYVPLFLKFNNLGKDQIGFIMAIGSVVAIMGQPFFGYWSDKIQSTKKILVIVIILSFLLSFLFFFAASFIWLLLFYALFMFFKTSCGPLTENIAVQFTTTHNKNYGSIRMWGAIGVGTGSLFIGYLVGWIGIEHIGYIYAAIIILALPLVFLLTDYRKKNQGFSISISAVKRLLSNKEYIWILFISFVIMITHKMNDSLFAVYLSDLGATPSQIGFAWMLATFASVPAFAFTGMLIRRYNELTLIMIAASLYSIRWLMYASFDHPQILTYLQISHGVTFPVFFVAAFYYVTRLIPKELIATGHTIFIAVIMGMTGLIGSSGGGWIMEHISPQASYQVGSVISLFGAMLAGITIVYMRHK